MRYFIEENSKDYVSLESELKFIDSYIQLEKIRFHSSIAVIIDKKVNRNISIPPMLLIPLVENIFKHGISNNGHLNEIEICINFENSRLYFMAKNTIHQSAGNTRTGTGLNNLRERLVLLYKDAFALQVRNNDQYFIAELSIPIYEN
jgi:LytS/YehU family sensor histidine kinase